MIVNVIVIIVSSLIFLLVIYATIEYVKEELIGKPKKISAIALFVFYIIVDVVWFICLLSDYSKLLQAIEG